MKQFFYFGTLGVFLFATLGELIRLPIATANGILPNDLWVALLVGTWLLYKTFGERSWPKSSLWAPFLTFALLALISLVNGSRELTTSETLSSGLYWVRFVEYFLLTFVVMDVASIPLYREKLFRIMVGAAAALAILGFFQLKFVPNFSSYQDLGWDPHNNRLLSTWFDPNFVGGLFAFALSFAVGKGLFEKKISHKVLLATVATILVGALFLTYSRSAYLAFMGAMGIVGLLQSRKLIVGALIASLLLISVSDRAEERVTNMWHSAKSLFTTSAELPDATARLRVESWQNAYTIWSDHPWLGVGYNAYAYVQADYGFVKELDKHSATGSDSTLLTILATTGVFGALAYLWIVMTFLWQSFVCRKDGMALGFFAGLCGLLVHSLFVNSLLFTPLLVFVYAGAGLALSAPRPRG